MENKKIKVKKEIKLYAPGYRDIHVPDIKRGFLHVGFKEEEAEKLAKIVFLYYNSGVRAANPSIDNDTREKAMKIMYELLDKLQKDFIPPQLALKMFFDLICLYGNHLPDIENEKRENSVEVQ